MSLMFDKGKWKSAAVQVERLREKILSSSCQKHCTQA